MKNIKYLALLIGGMLAFTGCSLDTDYPAYKPGEPEAADNYAIAFPNDQNSTFSLTPDAPTTVTMTALRTGNKEGAITVPVVVTVTADMPDADGKLVPTDVSDLFTTAPVSFADGADSTAFSVSFPEAVIGVDYTYTIAVDPSASQYTGMYAMTSFTATIARVYTWHAVTGPNGAATGKWRDDFIGAMYGASNPNAETDVAIEERDDTPGIYRMKPYTDAYLSDMFGEDMTGACDPAGTWITVDASNPDAVFVPLQTTGVTLSPDDGTVWIGSRSEVGMGALADWSGTMADGVISFSKPQTVLVYFNETDGPYVGDGSGLFRICLPGVTPPAEE